MTPLYYVVTLTIGDIPSLPPASMYEGWFRDSLTGQTYANNNNAFELVGAHARVVRGSAGTSTTIAWLLRFRDEYVFRGVDTQSITAAGRSSIAQNALYGFMEKLERTAGESPVLFQSGAVVSSDPGLAGRVSAEVSWRAYEPGRDGSVAWWRDEAYLTRTREMPNQGREEPASSPLPLPPNVNNPARPPAPKSSVGVFVAAGAAAGLGYLFFRKRQGKR